MTVNVPDRFKAANAFWMGLAKIGLTPAAVLSQARLPLTIYDGKKIRFSPELAPLPIATGHQRSGPIRIPRPS